MRDDVHAHVDIGLGPLDENEEDLEMAFRVVVAWKEEKEQRSLFGFKMQSCVDFLKSSFLLLHFLLLSPDLLYLLAKA